MHGRLSVNADQFTIFIEDTSSRHTFDFLVVILYIILVFNNLFFTVTVKMNNMQNQDVANFIFCVLSIFWKTDMKTPHSLRGYIKMRNNHVTLHDQNCDIVVFLIGDNNTLNRKDMHLFTIPLIIIDGYIAYRQYILFPV